MPIDYNKQMIHAIRATRIDPLESSLIQPTANETKMNNKLKIILKHPSSPKKASTKHVNFKYKTVYHDNTNPPYENQKSQKEEDSTIKNPNRSMTNRQIMKNKNKMTLLYYLLPSQKKTLTISPKLLNLPYTIQMLTLMAPNSRT